MNRDGYVLAPKGQVNVTINHGLDTFTLNTSEENSKQYLDTRLEKPQTTQRRHKMTPDRLKREKEQQLQLDQRTKALISCLKLVVVSVSVTVFFYLKSTPLRGVDSVSNSECLHDYFLVFLGPANYALHEPEYRNYRDALQILSSLQIDLGFLAYCFIW